MATSPALPGPSVEALIRAPFCMNNSGVLIVRSPASPVEPRAALLNKPVLPEISIESVAFTVKFPALPSAKVAVVISAPLSNTRKC